MEKNTIWARANYLFFELGKNSPFSFSCFAKSLLFLIYSFEKGLIFSEKGLKIISLKRRFSSRGAAVAECQNRNRKCFKFIAVARLGRECSSQEGSLGDLTDAR